MHPHRRGVDDRQLVDAHGRGARGVQRGLGVGADPVEDLLVGGDGRAGGELAVVVRREGRLVEDVARHPDRLDPLAPVVRCRQVVEEHRRVLLGVLRDDPDPAAGVGVHGPDVHLVAVALGGRRAVVADGDRQEVEHQVGVVDVLVAAGEAAALEVVGGAEAATVEQPLVADARALVPLQARARSRPAAWRRTGCRPRGGPGGSRRRRAGGARAARRPRRGAAGRRRRRAGAAAGC